MPTCHFCKHELAQRGHRTEIGLDGSVRCFVETGVFTAPAGYIDTLNARSQPLAPEKPIGTITFWTS